MTGDVLTEFTGKVNLRHFFVPREVVPRTIEVRCRVLTGMTTLLNNHFRADLTENPECMILS
jgi:hypothetical protein